MLWVLGDLGVAYSKYEKENKNVNTEWVTNRALHNWNLKRILARCSLQLDTILMKWTAGFTIQRCLTICGFYVLRLGRFTFTSNAVRCRTACMVLQLSSKRGLWKYVGMLLKSSGRINQNCIKMGSCKEKSRRGWREGKTATLLWLHLVLYI